MVSQRAEISHHACIGGLSSLAYAQKECSLSRLLSSNLTVRRLRVKDNVFYPCARVTGDIAVTRSNSTNETSFWMSDHNSNYDNSGGDGYTWTITFPLSARDAPELGFDGAALKGKGAAGNIVQTRVARAPEVQRVSTLAGSEVYGGFTLTFSDDETEQLPYNATANEVGTTIQHTCVIATLYAFVLPLRCFFSFDSKFESSANTNTT